MGILVHRSFPYEEANGVALTKNPYNVNHGYSVNVQFADISIVNPEPGIIHDQLVIYNFSISGKESYTLEYINHSNVFPSFPDKVMTKDELFELADYLSIIKQYFYKNVYPCQCNYNSFGLDVEFKVDSDISDRKIYIKQVRSY